MINYYPEHLRRIYIEDVKESLAKDFDSHQIFFQVSDTDKSKNKSQLIISLLHRSPDFVYLGEILTREESKAMFHALSVGLKGFQTIHAQNIENLINRWLFHYNINPASLESLGLIVLMGKFGNRRIVGEIAEIRIVRNKPRKNSIAMFNPREDTWVYTKNLFNCFKVQEKLRYQNLQESDFESDLAALEKIIIEN